MHAKTSSEKRGHEFEEQEGVCGRAERKEREGRNIIVKY